MKIVKPVMVMSAAHMRGFGDSMTNLSYRGLIFS